MLVCAIKGEWGGMGNAAWQLQTALRCEGPSHQHERNNVKRMELTYLEVRRQVVGENQRNT